MQQSVTAEVLGMGHCGQHALEVLNMPVPQLHEFFLLEGHVLELVEHLAEQRRSSGADKEQRSR
jgi:hypothetical protein